MTSILAQVALTALATLSVTQLSSAASLKERDSTCNGHSEVQY